MKIRTRIAALALIVGTAFFAGVGVEHEAYKPRESLREVAVKDSRETHPHLHAFDPFASTAQAQDKAPSTSKVSEDGKSIKVGDKTYALGYKPPPEAVRARTIKQTGHVRFPRVSAPKWDCRQLGIVPNVRDQGNCGSCWDFAGSSTVTSALIKAGVLKLADDPRCSEQYVLDCGNNGGCNGDDHSSVFDMAKGKGLPLASEYGPYQARAGRCKDMSGMHFYSINAWGYCDPGKRGVADTQKIKDAMVQYGPISVAIDAGVLGDGTRPITGSGHSINHEVIVVGWVDNSAAGEFSLPQATTGGWWIMRNSWSAGWGQKCGGTEGGYCYIAYGSGDIGVDAAWVSVTPVPPPPLPPGPIPPPAPVPGASPAITSPLTATAQIGANFSYQVTATNNPTAFAASGLPAGLTIATNTGLITGVVTTTGTANVTLIAANGSGAGTATLILTIGTGPAPGNVTIVLTPDQVRSVINQSGAVVVTPDMTIQQVIDALAKVKEGKSQPQCCLPPETASDDKVRAAQQSQIDALKRGVSAILDRLDALKQPTGK